MKATIGPARLVLPDGVVDGVLDIEDGCIAHVDGTPVDADAAAGDALDGRYVLPGLIEPHTDNVERHLLPRPAARWPDALAALLAHDAEIATSGITTVHDALRLGAHEGESRERASLFGEAAAALARADAAGLLRVEHRLHLRAELTDPALLDEIEPYVDDPRVTILSLMDHTPGQRQWRDVESLLKHKGGTEGAARAIEVRIAVGQRHVADNRRRVVARVAERVAAGTLTLASHDDTVLEHVEQALAEGVRIAEFPCTLEAAVAGAARGQWNLGGAPNVVRRRLALGQRRRARHPRRRGACTGSRPTTSRRASCRRCSRWRARAAVRWPTPSGWSRARPPSGSGSTIAARSRRDGAPI